MKSVMLKMDAGTRFDQLPEQAQRRIKQLKGRWAGAQMPHSRVTGRTKLIDGIVDDSFTEADAEAQGWTVIYHAQAVTIRYDEEGNEISREVGGKRPNGWTVFKALDEAEYLKHLPDNVEYDEQGNEVSRSRPSQVYEAHRFMGWPPRI